MNNDILLGSATHLAQAKSDQLTAADITGAPITVMITGTNDVGGDQALHIFISDRAVPWKPSKGQIRVIIGCFGKYRANWIGQQITLFCEDSVTWAGKAAGGIRVSAATHGHQSPKSFMIPTSRSKKVKIMVDPIPFNTYSDDAFNENCSKWIAAIEGGKATFEQVVCKVAQSAILSLDQRITLLRGNNDIEQEPEYEVEQPEQHAINGFTPPEKTVTVPEVSTEQQAPSEEEIKQNF